ncbi:F-box incomplete domain containing protein [Pandoravirus macleodensis]|uniref:F-box incomplete domain containing protein n=1 Tax=Pandoravirus macleodensis TaxID=2107707 RepID=A0A2U7UFP2_9VIRU|nr:F-box incomplete domain containing protein [Pandoravirus macleodensis]AVK77232.1 F-box incomplete domain containing protein [Pandoravirus macleodensis]UMO79962.1 F-box incomplete domain containing protein [Pandoravirus aubagnensis]
MPSHTSARLRGQALSLGYGGTGRAQECLVETRQPTSSGEARGRAQRHGNSVVAMACEPGHSGSSGPSESASVACLPVEMLTAIIIGALDSRWRFCARRVCRSWRDIVDAETVRNAVAGHDDNVAIAQCVLASAVIAMYDGAPHEMVDFCLASAAYTQDHNRTRSDRRCQRPIERRDVLLALLASARPLFVDYAVDCLSTLTQQGSAPALGRCVRDAVGIAANDDDGDDKSDSGIFGDLDRVYASVGRAGSVGNGYGDCDDDDGDDDDDDNVDGVWNDKDDAFYRRIGDIVVRRGGVTLLRALVARVDGFHPTRHVDPVQVIDADAADMLGVIDRPPGVFWRTGYAAAVRACRIPAFWHEAGRVDATGVIASFQSQASPAAAAECAPAAARAAVAHGCTGVLDLIAAHRHTRGVVSRARLVMLWRRAAAACNPRGFAWCVGALNALGSRVNPVDAATDAVMGPWRESEPCAPWDTQKAVAFLQWLHAFDSAALRAPAAIVEIIHCATLPRRPMGDRERRAHTHAVAECLARLGVDNDAATS